MSAARAERWHRADRPRWPVPRTVLARFTRVPDHAVLPGRHGTQRVRHLRPAAASELPAAATELDRSVLPAGSDPAAEWPVRHAAANLPAAAIELDGPVLSARTDAAARWHLQPQQATAVSTPAADLDRPVLSAGPVPATRRQLRYLPAQLPARSIDVEGRVLSGRPDAASRRHLWHSRILLGLSAAADQHHRHLLPVRHQAAA